MNCNLRYALVLQLFSMNNLYKSNATIDTYQMSSSGLHNCPTCRCKSTEHSAKLSCSISQPYLRPLRNEPNLYLSKEASEASTQRFGYRPYQSTIFNKPNRIQFKYSTGVPAKAANISFSYTSPPREKKHHSSEARFNTKRFKESKFPQISREDMDSVKVVAVKPSPYYEVYTKEKTPEKHRVLKMKKDKSKKNMAVSQSNSSNERAESVPESTIQQNEYAISGPSNTPINALWLNGSQKTQKELTNEEIYRMANKDNPPASIQCIDIKSSKLVNSPQPEAKERQSNKKYPTIESLEAYETRRENQSSPVSAPKEETSLRFVKEPSYESEEIEIARSISEQLQLNFDYYYPMDESDRSLSLHVDL